MYTVNTDLSKSNAVFFKVNRIIEKKNSLLGRKHRVRLFSPSIPITTFPTCYPACAWMLCRKRNPLPTKAVNSHFTSFIHPFKHFKVPLGCSGIVLDSVMLFACVRLKYESLQPTSINLFFISSKLTSVIHSLLVVLQVFGGNVLFLGHSYLCSKHFQFWILCSYDVVLCLLLHSSLFDSIPKWYHQNYCSVCYLTSWKEILVSLSSFVHYIC